MRGELRGQVDERCATQAGLVERVEVRLRPGLARRFGGFDGPPPGFPALPERRGGSAEYVQFVPERAAAGTSPRVAAVARGDGARSSPTPTSTTSTCAC